MTNTQHQEISATAAAVLHIQKMLAKKGAGVGMRLSVKNSGCSGKSYVVTLVSQEEISSDDHVYEVSGESENNTKIKICVDPDSFIYTAGLMIDYVKKGLNGSFIFHNPNEKASCGCGESFYV